MRYALAALVIAIVLVLVLVGLAKGDPTTTETSTTDTSPTTVTVADPDVPRLRAKLARERRLLAAYRARTRGAIRTLRRAPSTQEALTIACATYGACSTLRRRAYCESRLDPLAANPSGASGLFQFLPSTFASTPYRSLSIWSPYANALAAGWMQAHGRGGEWSCR